MTEKICPMMTGRIVTPIGHGASTLEAPCAGSKCAWYDARRECCAVLAIAKR